MDKSRRLTLFLLIPFVLSADVTVRYKTEMTMNKALPGAADPAKLLGNALPVDRTVLEKDGKASSTINNGYTAITDFNTKQVVILDTAGKRYAKLDSDRLGDMLGGAMPQIPAAAGALLASMKFNVSSPKKTGRTAAIQGVQAEEQEIEVTMDGPALPGMPPGPMMREVIQFWMAAPGEALRVPAIRELTGYALWSVATTNPMAQLEAMFKQMPGMSDVFAGLTKMQQGVLLRMHVAAYMPGLAAMMRQLPAANNPLAGIDANAPLFQMNQEVVEISSAPIPASQFEIPAGFEEAAAADIIKGMMPATPPAVPSPAAQ